MTANYDAELPKFQTIPADEIKKPVLPIKQFLHEAELLHLWVQTDKDALTKAGLDWQLVEALPARTDALREAESRWYKERFAHEDAERAWEAQSPQGYALRDKLVRDMRFAFRKDEALLKRVAGIADGTGHVDMVQDLSDLATLGRDYADTLAAVGVNPAELEQAAELADTLGTLLAGVAQDRMLGNGSRVLRDQAYTHLRLAVEEIREHGQYVFWNDEVRQDGYYSLYNRTNNGARSTSKTPEAAPEPTEA